MRPASTSHLAPRLRPRRQMPKPGRTGRFCIGQRVQNPPPAMAPNRPGGPRALRSGRTRSAAPSAADPAARPDGPASARTVGATRRTPVPSPTEPPPPAAPGTPPPARRGTSAAPSCPLPARRAPPAPGFPPARTAWISPSGTVHSARRPASPLPRPRGPESTAKPPPSPNAAPDICRQPNSHGTTSQPAVAGRGGGTMARSRRPGPELRP
jgi:hypothetical protein